MHLAAALSPCCPICVMRSKADILISDSCVYVSAEREREEYYLLITLNPQCSAPGATGNNGAVIRSGAATNL